MWTIEQTSPCVTTLRVKAVRNADWEWWMLLSSDRHLDNPKSLQDMQRRHLEQAKQRDAAVIDTGDLFCAMQGKNDRRSSKGDLRRENAERDYLGSLTRSAVDFFTPYKKNLAILAKGNHETAILKNCEYDLTRALTDRLRDNGSPVIAGGYRGWVRMLFESGGNRQSLNLYYTHGAGGGGPVTKGVIGTNRRAVYLPDAAIVIGGHIHEAWCVELCRTRLTTAGREYQDDQTHLCLPTYKDEFGGQSEGFHVEGERPPKPIGAWWLRFFWDAHTKRIRFEPTRAK